MVGSVCHLSQRSDEKPVVRTHADDTGREDSRQYSEFRDTRVGPG